MQYEDFDKQLIALEKEQNPLYISRYKPEYEPLLPPVQKGWKRFFVLRDDVARSNDAQFFENILKKINTKTIYWKKDFKVRKRKLGRKIYVVQPQELFKPDENEFIKLKFTEKEKSFFLAEFHYNSWKRKFELRYVFNEPWRFVLCIRPNMIDKQRKIHPEKEARLDEIRNYLKRNNYDKRLYRMVNGHYQYKYWKVLGVQIEKPKEKNPFKNKSASDIIDLVKQEFF
jgi:hypothetical protein